MTLRANITTTYRDVNASVPRATKNVQKETLVVPPSSGADQGIHESAGHVPPIGKGSRNPMKPATKAPDRGTVPLTKHLPKDRLVTSRPLVVPPSSGSGSAVRNDGRTSATADVFERSSPKDKLVTSRPSGSVLAQGAGPDKPASDSRPDTNEREVASKPALAGYGPGSGGPIIKKTDKESPASQKYSAPVPDRSPLVVPPSSGDKHSGSMVKSLAPPDPPKSDKSRENSSSGRRSKAPDLWSRPAHRDRQSQSLPVAALPKIRMAEPSPKGATGSAEASPSSVDKAPALVVPPSLVTSRPSGSGSVSDEDAMQRELAASLQFGWSRPAHQEQAQEDNSQTDSATAGSPDFAGHVPPIGIGSGDAAKHLQSEGVFGISASGRNLGAVDFIRQKQFEYTMDQKPFTTDDLLLEAEKAIHGTLNSDQSSAVSKSLLLAAESVNAYRNHSVRSSERAEIAAKPIRVAASTSKEEV